MKRRLPRLMLAAPGSGGGKTALTCALLHALREQGMRPAAFKCGPDYIDPMFHTETTGVPSRNLDLFFAPEALVRGLLLTHSEKADIAVLEGVMGYYDGIGDTTRAGSHHLARATETPVILTVNPRGMSLSAAAMVKGFLAFRPEHQIAGLILNPCGEGLHRFLKPVLERETGLPVAGYLPELPDCAFESRHLGLVAAGEIGDLREKIRKLGEQLARTVDLRVLREIAASAPELTGEAFESAPVTDRRPIIAVARDEAFCFYYQDNLDLLEKLGAKPAAFSPLRDEALPRGTSALYLGGGYPELHADTLSRNGAMRAAVLQAARAGMPVVAECGGFQYLQDSLADTDGNRFPMAGVILSESAPAGGLRRFGYVTLRAERDTLLCDAGEEIPAHEFHHWDSTVTGDAFAARKASGSGGWPCIVAEGNLFAGYPHLYFPANPAFAERFVRAAAKFSDKYNL